MAYSTLKMEAVRSFETSKRRHFPEDTTSIVTGVRTCNPITLVSAFNTKFRRYLIATCFTLVSFLAYSSTLKKDTIYPSGTTGDFQQTIRRYMPEGRTFLLFNSLTDTNYGRGDISITHFCALCTNNAKQT
jgi:hypothetical protein